ncbi:hypothetical protein KWH04_09765 [Xanthomonas campestris pv. trichodesmae]|uniref:hypothetical protein n=1 Tax=Xanthomonas TaxID=338 RepID=UPI0012FE4170|nr:MULTISPECIES: hypothetical protein [Xanthomonas]MBV6780928.1 hypothetical protein [Xanthomonas campestris pv. trichodesmae]MBV6788452.1 hypothetical protein [Xanthomonas campestris pv. clerodendri]
MASTTGGWRVEAHADGQGPYAACYPATSLNGALRVAGLLLRGERVPADYRNWS